MSEFLQVGIVGFGRIGAEHAGWLSKANGIRAAAVADATPARRERAQAAGLRSHEQMDAMLADAAIDAVLISTPTAMHFDHARRALLAGKHVLVEKPMAMDLGEARALVDLADKEKRTLSVFHNRRWDLDYLTLKEAVEANRFGKIFNVESRLGQWASCVGPAAREYRPNWRNEASYGGGGLFDWGSHFIDQMWRLLLPAKPVRVFAQMRANVWSKDSDDFARVLIDFDSGAAALVEINTTTALPMPRWHIDGEKGSAQSPHSSAFDLKRWAQFEFMPAPVEGGTQLPPQALPLSTAAISESAIWERFGAAIRGEGPPAVSADSVLATMSLLDAARESSKTGKSVDIK